jgi:hypothetical protein
VLFLVADGEDGRYNAAMFVLDVEEGVELALIEVNSVGTFSSSSYLVELAGNPIDLWNEISVVERNMIWSDSDKGTIFPVIVKMFLELSTRRCCQNAIER